MLIFIHMRLQAEVSPGMFGAASVATAWYIVRCIRGAMHTIPRHASTEHTSSIPHYRQGLDTRQGTCWTLAPTC